MVREYLPPVTTVNEANIDTFKGIDNAVFIAYLTPKDKELEAIFTAAAKANHRDFVFGLTYESVLAESGKFPVPSVVCHKLREGENEILAAPFDAKLFKQFMRATTTPIIGEMTKRNMNDYLGVR